ncbi:hypothetical protein VFPPC_15539 [Pochonia chlamydosporia 170]|uniref:Uncharacterized protein n=1 Tax=Pochonia chlamydosporia 170 TaxID=1380566 RepID=A0A179FYF2_METCM|nr:hypothetical protein VFPPC_15539 [Pochonia chlamydosporia 170]OAQ70141.1 hypothetical protein VFPPC_15539 [Pochonia chlamydosporia 170]
MLRRHLVRPLVTPLTLPSFNKGDSLTNPKPFARHSRGYAHILQHYIQHYLPIFFPLHLPIPSSSWYPCVLPVKLGGPTVTGTLNLDATHTSRQIHAPDWTHWQGKKHVD